MSPRLTGVKVVLVDDDQDVLEAMDTAMKAEGAITRPVADGNQAVDVCQEEPPDLVILDMMLPKRSGFLVLEKIKGYEEAPIVIMLTANEGRRHQAYAESLGVDAYMLKPVPLERLLSKSIELLALRHARKTSGTPPQSPTATATPTQASASKPGEEAATPRRKSAGPGGGKST